MSAVPFTPEPLFVKDYHGTFDIINRPSYGEAGTKNIAHVIPYGGERFCTHEEANAYAKLFAASPDLLGALKELLECDYTSGTHLYTAQIRAKNAIIKATL